MTQRLPIPGSDDGTWGSILNGFLGVSLNTDGTLSTTALQSAGAITSINSLTPTSGALSLKLTNLADTTTASSASNGQVLAYNSSSNSWIPSTVSSTTVNNATTSTPGLIQLAGDLAGTATTPTITNSTNVEAIISANTTVAGAAQKANNLSDLASTSTARTNLGLGSAATISSTAGGDLSGTLPSPTVAKVNGVAVTGTPSSGQVITASSSSAATWATPSGGGGAVSSVDGMTGAVTGLLQASNNLSDVAVASTARTNLGLGTAATISSTAGGDLSGTLPSPTVAKVNGVAVTGTPSSGQVITASSSSAATWATPSAASELAPTAVKTSAYNASVGDFVPVDVSSASVTVTLPHAPSDKSQIGVKIIKSTLGNTLTISASGGDVFNIVSGATSLTLQLLHQGAILQYTTSSAIWYVLTDDTPLDQIPQTPVTINSYSSGWTLSATDIGAEGDYNSSSAGTVTIPPNSSVDAPVGSMAVFRQVGTGSLTVAAGAGVTVHGSLTVMSQYGTLVAVQTAANTWDVVAAYTGTQTVHTVASSGTTQTLLAAQINYLELTANCTLTAPTAGVGVWFDLDLLQDGTGSRTVTWFGSLKWPGGSAPTLTTAANKMDSFTFHCDDGTNWIASIRGQNI